METYRVELRNPQNPSQGGEIELKASNATEARNIAERQNPGYSVVKVQELPTINYIASLVATGISGTAAAFAKNPKVKVFGIFASAGVQPLTKWLLDNHKEDLEEFFQLMTPYGQAKAAGKIVDQIWDKYH